MTWLFSRTFSNSYTSTFIPLCPIAATFKKNVVETETHLCLVPDISVKVSGNLLVFGLRCVYMYVLLMLKKVLTIPCY